MRGPHCATTVNRRGLTGSESPRRAVGSPSDRRRIAHAGDLPAAALLTVAAVRKVSARRSAWIAVSGRSPTVDPTGSKVALRAQEGHRVRVLALTGLIPVAGAIQREVTDRTVLIEVEDEALR